MKTAVNKEESLTIMLSSQYPTTDAFYESFNDEITTDLNTVMDYFPSVLNIVIPASTTLSNKALEIQKQSVLIQANAYINAHPRKKINLVLNTHGNVGSYDIDNRLIIALSRLILKKDREIQTIYGLMCDGFSTRKAPEDIISSMGTPYGANKMAALVKLGRQLSKIKTNTFQSFTLRGVTSVYDPKLNKDLVLALIDEDTSSLAITQHTISTAKENRLADHHAYSFFTPDKIAEERSKVMAEILCNIENHFIINETLIESSERLFNLVKLFSKKEDFSSFYAFKAFYYAWTRDAKETGEDHPKQAFLQSLTPVSAPHCSFP